MTETTGAGAIAPAASPRHPRGVYTAPLAHAVGGEQFWVYDSRGVLCAHGTYMNAAEGDRAMIAGLARFLNALDPDHTTAAEPLTEAEHRRSQIACMDGGNRPTTGRQRARKPLGVVRGGRYAGGRA